MVIVHVGFWLDGVGVACVACWKFVKLEQVSKVLCKLMDLSYNLVWCTWAYYGGVFVQTLTFRICLPSVSECFLRNHSWTDSTFLWCVAATDDSWKVCSIYNMQQKCNSTL